MHWRSCCDSVLQAAISLICRDLVNIRSLRPLFRVIGQTIEIAPKDCAFLRSDGMC
jgi:hypothetical protein